MRRVLYGGAMSLDGYIAGPNGEYDWIIMDPEIDFVAMAARFDTFLIGRKTFDAMRRMGSAGQATPGIQNIVCSRTLKPEDFPAVTVTADAERVVAELRTRPGRDIAVFGGGELFRSLLAAGMVDGVEVSADPRASGRRDSLSSASRRTSHAQAQEAAPLQEERHRRARVRHRAALTSAVQLHRWLCREGDSRPARDKREEGSFHDTYRRERGASWKFARPPPGFCVGFVLFTGIGCSQQPTAPSGIGAPPAARTTALTPDDAEAQQVVSASRFGRRTPGVVYVTSQGLYDDTFVVKDPLPMNGPFQLLEEGQTDFGPGQPGYLGGRWWEDTNGNGVEDPSITSSCARCFHRDGRHPDPGAEWRESSWSSPHCY